jgi:hypothetical protein
MALPAGDVYKIGSNRRLGPRRDASGSGRGWLVLVTHVDETLVEVHVDDVGAAPDLGWVGRSAPVPDQDTQDRVDALNLPARTASHRQTSRGRTVCFCRWRTIETSQRPFAYGWFR